MVARSSRVARSTLGIPPLAVGCVFVRGLLSHGEDESHQATKNYTFPIGLFNALVIFAREGERQCRGNGGDCSVEVGCGLEARAPRCPHAVALGVRAARVQRRRRVEDRAPVPSTPSRMRAEGPRSQVSTYAEADAGRRPAHPGVRLRWGGCGPEARAPRCPPTLRRMRAGGPRTQVSPHSCLSWYR